MVRMPAKTVASPLRRGASAILLLALFFASSTSFCGGLSIERLEISRDENATRPETTIPQGNLQGRYMVTHHNRTISGFLGIPYAQPPLGDLRFKAPLPPGPWNGTLDAGNDTEPCLQFNSQNEVYGNEDCLYLNVFTPRLPASNDSTLLPVMVFLIGGAFKTGVNAIDRFSPEFLLDEDLVLVIPNFRLGALGFLTTGDEVAPGNYGVKDALRVLQWIQESIEYFGGDPNQVTLSGGSSGAMTVHLLTLSNLSEGLFHQCIFQSGSVLDHNYEKSKERHVKLAFQLGEYLGCPTNASTLLVNCLKELNASQLINPESLFYQWSLFPRGVWGPTIEPDIEGAVLTDKPANLYAAGKIRDLPWLASLSTVEGFGRGVDFYVDPDLFEDLLANVTNILPIIVGYGDKVDDVAAYTNALTSFYLNDLSANRSILLSNLTELLGDYNFVHPTITAVQQQLALAKSPIYLASFEYRGTFGHSYHYSGNSTEYSDYVAHGDEIIYLYGHQGDIFGPAGTEYSATDFIMIETMVQLWASFVINGTPTLRESDSTLVWEPYSSSMNYLRIGNGSDTAVGVEYAMHLERMQFWDELTKTKTAAPSSGSRNLVHVLSAAFCLCLLSHIM